MSRLRLAFRLAEDGRFLIKSEIYPDWLNDVPVLTTQTTYDDENTFLKLLLAAELPDPVTKELVIAAIVSVARPTDPPPWIPVEINPQQIAQLGLNLTEPNRTIAADSVPAPMLHASADFPFLAECTRHFYDFLMNSPTPFVMLEGPECVIRFINEPYLHILGRVSPDQVLGMAALEAIPELKGQECLAILKRANETGLPQARKELRCEFQQKDTGLLDEVYFDIIYQPMRDSSGSVWGVMAQATDVTERVLARQVTENREQKLYRLWAELEAIYRAAPLGIAVFDAADLRLLRMNKRQAEFLGGTVEALVGRTVADLDTVFFDLPGLLHKAAAGEAINDLLLEKTSCSSPAEHRSWRVTVKPGLNESGAVETLTLVALDTTASSASQPEFANYLNCAPVSDAG